MGTSEGDTIIDSWAANAIDGSYGDDRIYSSAASVNGIDRFDGGSGTNLISYALAASAVRVSLAELGAQNTGGGGTDILIDFDNLFGSKFGDALTGDGLANQIGGFDGDDVIEGWAATTRSTAARG